MKKILLCSDSFKGTISSIEINDIVTKVISSDYKNDFILTSLPIADGGEGMLDVIKYIYKDEGHIVEIKTIDAEYNKISIPVYIKGNEAYLETSLIIGLPNIKGNISPLKRTTRGVGIVINELINRNIKTIYVALGGSSTNDVGIGMLDELGIDFKIEKPTADNIKDIKDIDISKINPHLLNTKFIILSDVNSPLTGSKGASYNYGPQKGFTYKELNQLEISIYHYQSLVESKFKKKIKNVACLGAAGGLASAFYIYLNAEIKSGINTILELYHFQTLIKDNDFILSGEGAVDTQSFEGKVLGGILNYLDDKSKLYVLCGINRIKKDLGFKIKEITPRTMNKDESKIKAKQLYEKALRNLLDELKTK